MVKVGERVEKSSRHVPECLRLLDVGCGSGELADYIKDRVAEIHGVDGDSVALSDAKRKGYFRVASINLDKDKFPYKPEYFDCITCLDVIEHVRDPSNLLNNIYTVLKPHGILILTTPNIRFTNHLIRLVIEGSFPKTSTDTAEYDGGHIHFFTYSDIENLLQNAKYKVIKKDEIINKSKRGWKGVLATQIFGKDMMREFRSQGILIVSTK